MRGKGVHTGFNQFIPTMYLGSYFDSIITGGDKLSEESPWRRRVPPPPSSQTGSERFGEWGLCWQDLIALVSIARSPPKVPGLFTPSLFPALVPLHLSGGRGDASCGYTTKLKHTVRRYKMAAISCGELSGTWDTCHGPVTGKSLIVKMFTYDTICDLVVTSRCAS